MAKKLLLIDDDPLVLKTLKNVLGRAKYDLTTAENGSEAYDHVKKSSFDLVICDIRMPKEDGISFLKRIKEEVFKEKGKEIPFVFITGYANEDAPLDALKLGAKDYILKPFNLDDLLSCVSKNILKEEDEVKAPLKFFPLLIGGELVDTGKYKYVAHADDAIKDPMGTLKALKEYSKLDLNNSEESIQGIAYAKYCVCTDEHIDRAIESAYNAFQVYSDFSFAKRVKMINGIYELLSSEKDELINLMISEGHPEELSVWEYSGMEMAYRPESINFFKEQLRGTYGQHGDEQVGWIRKPDGVVVVSPPGNASCSNSLTAGFALLSGNCLIVKPPLRMPISTLYLWHEIIWKVLRIFGAPPGTVNTLVGNSKTITAKWMESPKVSDVFYFGDSVTGIEIGGRAYAAGKKPILELSGNDFLIAWGDSVVEKATESLCDCFLGSTQICMVPKKAIVHEDIYDKFEKSFLEKVSKLKVGLPSQKEGCLTPVVRIADFFDFLEDAKAKGAEVLCGGKRINYKNEVDEKGMYLQPTVLRLSDWKAALDMLCVVEENFFPLIPLIKVGSSSTEDRNAQIFEQMIHIVNSNKYGLRSSVWAKSDFYITKFIKKLNRCGLLRINSRHTAFSPYLTTHGGSGLSGGPFGEANHVWQKTTHLQSVSVVRG